MPPSSKAQSKMCPSHSVIDGDSVIQWHRAPFATLDCILKIKFNCNRGLTSLPIKWASHSSDFFAYIMYLHTIHITVFTLLHMYAYTRGGADMLAMLNRLTF